MLADSGFEVITQGSLGISDADETGLTFVENALLKARHAALASGLPALADDSGLCVDHLQGAPGLYSARYSGGHGNAAANNAKLLREMNGVPAAERGAFFICVLVLLRHADDPAPLIAEGRWYGRILDEGRGSGGFGYNPVFLPEGYNESVAEMDAALKNRLSHRGQALAKLHAQLAAR
jgi:XTP/dITP diphosphohydrolase